MLLCACTVVCTTVVAYFSTYPMEWVQIIQGCGCTTYMVVCRDMGVYGSMKGCRCIWWYEGLWVYMVV